MTIAVSGGFDPIHPGHIRMIGAAAEHGPVVVILNSDDWLRRKKGFVFQPWQDRAEILSAVRGVQRVEPVDDSDGSVCEALRRIKPGIFVNGGDRTIENTPELDVCLQLGIATIFGVGGAKAGSSSQIAERATVKRSWGRYTVLAEGDRYKVKRLIVDPFSVSSLQRHFQRSEVWVFPDGRQKFIGVGEWHRLENVGADPLEITEVQVGICREDDIERAE